MMFAQTTRPSVAAYTPPAPQMPPTAQPQQFAVETQGVTKRYGRQTVVNQLNLAVPSGGVYGFLGPNGAGKSTTMKMLLGLAKPTTGEVRVFGRDLRANRADILPRIGSTRTSREPRTSASSPTTSRATRAPSMLSSTSWDSPTQPANARASTRWA